MNLFCHTYRNTNSEPREKETPGRNRGYRVICLDCVRHMGIAYNLERNFSTWIMKRVWVP